jgi:hypothetical protein
MTTVNIVAWCLGAALVVFFAGTTAAVAAGQTVPSALWASGSAISGALVGVLLPAPKAKERHERAADAATDPATATEHRELAASTPDTTTTVRALVVIFLVMLGLSIVIAAGVFNPQHAFGAEPLTNISKAVLALASASGSALIGIYAPASGKES